MKIFRYDNKDCKFKKVPYTLLLIVLSAILMFSTIMSLYMSRTVYKTVLVPQEAEMIILNKQNEFSEEAFDLYLNSFNLKFPHIAKAQAKLESANFSSEVFKANNNMFGMRKATIRPTTNVGSNLGHAVYENWRASVQDYVLYSAAYLRELKTEEDYYQYLGNNYAEDPNYVKKLKEIVKNESKVLGNKK